MGHRSRQNTMNFDLNLAPVVYPSQDNQPQATRSEEQILRSLRALAVPPLPSPSPSPPRPPPPSPSPSAPPVSRHVPDPVESNTALRLLGDSDNSDTEQPNENGEKQVEKKVMGKEEEDKSKGDECSFFDCNICLDLASDPVVTCCGHLFCWPCLYRWLFVHSASKECPICKGEVTMKTITPIYSRGNQKQNAAVTDSGITIPSRPQANRVESWRQSIQRTTLNMPMFEMIRRFDNDNDNQSDPSPETGTENPRETPSSSLLSRIFTSRGMRRGRDAPPTNPPDATGDPQSSSSRRQSNRAGTMLSFESIFQEQFQMMANQDSRSSIPGVSSLGSQVAEAADTRAETGSRALRRICESSTSRVADVNSGEPRSRRRRLL